MNRSTVLYVVLTLAFAGAVWGILAVGGTLPAAPDLAGKYDLAWDPAALPAGAKERLPETLDLSQSGLFVTVTTGPSTVLLRGRLRRSDDGLTYHFESYAGAWPLRIEPVPAGGTARLAVRLSNIPAAAHRRGAATAPAPANQGH